jgi:hypothetical protein
VMAIQEIPGAEWPTFLERFGSAHRAWLATIHGIERGMPVTRVPSVPIKSVGLERDAAGPLVRLTFGNGVSLCAVGPCAVRLQRTDDGLAHALEIEAVDGVLVRVAFRATAAPEQLDGLAPGEVTDRFVTPAADTRAVGGFQT